MTQAPTTPPVHTPEESSSGGNMIVLIVAVIVALVAVVMTFFVLQAEKQKTKLQTITAWEFKRPMSAGAKLREEDLRQVEVHRDMKEKVYVGLITTEQQKNQRVEKFLRRDVPKGEYLRMDWFTDVPSESQNSWPLIEGESAFAITVNNNNPPNFLKPGDIIDVYAYYTLPRTKVSDVLKVLTNVRVVRVNGFTDIGDANSRNATNIRNVTIHVKTEDLKKILKAQQYSNGQEFVITGTDSSRTALPRFNPEVEKIIAQMDVDRTKRRSGLPTNNNDPDALDPTNTDGSSGDAPTSDPLF